MVADTSAPRFPLRLTAPAPGWTTRADVVVVGSGIAGLTAALRIHAADRSLRLMVVTKDVLHAGSTQWAQGGIAAAWGPGTLPSSTCTTRWWRAGRATWTPYARW